MPIRAKSVLAVAKLASVEVKSVLAVVGYSSVAEVFLSRSVGPGCSSELEGVAQLSVWQFG